MTGRGREDAPSSPGTGGEPAREGIFPATSLLDALVGAGAFAALYDPPWRIYFEHEGEPQAKERARFDPRSGKFYTPKGTAEGEEAFAWSWRLATRHLGIRLEGNLALVAVFFRSNKKTIDADNLMKLVKDAATKAHVWRDDSQVTAETSVLELDLQRPRTLVGVCPILSTMDRR